MNKRLWGALQVCKFIGKYSVKLYRRACSPNRPAACHRADECIDPYIDIQHTGILESPIHIGVNRIFTFMVKAEKATPL